MELPLSSRACGGLHVVNVLTKMLGQNHRPPRLSVGKQKQVRAFLANKIQIAVLNQVSDGGWPADWCQNSEQHIKEEARYEPIVERILPTGHLLEWLSSVPPEFRPPEELFLEGVKFLVEALRNVSEKDVREHYCPYSHAVCAILNLQPREKGGTIPDG